MPVIGNPILWSKFGLPGLVIFVLFSILVAVVWFVVKRFDKIDERNINHNKSLAQAHRDERLEWRNNSDKQLDRFENAITRLADGIRDTRSKND
jgi:hypothetical protein